MDNFVSLTASMCLYGGAVMAVVGLLTLARPVRLLGIGTRRRAAGVVLAGLALPVIGFLVPVRERRIETPGSELDRYFPAWQFAERHEIAIDAPPARVYRALKDVTAEEIALFQMLTWIRRLGRQGPEGLLNAPDKKPILDVATQGGFRVFADHPGRETLLVTMLVVPRGGSRLLSAEDVRTLAAPGYAKAGMNFLIEPIDADRSRLVTETRVFATDPPTIAIFKRYWRMIYPGSAIIRIAWLRAVKQRAERPS